MKSIFEEMGGTYTLGADGLYYPDLALPEMEEAHYGKYEYTISPNVSPQWLSIDITDCSAMTIQVSNLGGDTNCIGFADTRFE